MQTLDYHTPAKSTARLPASLLAAPIIGAVATVIAAGHSMSEEPFGNFSVTDAIIQVGSPTLAVSLWIYWCVVARRRRLPIAAVIPSIAWAGLHLWFALWLGIGYFYEPWNY
jgi:hypothetical protein